MDQPIRIKIGFYKNIAVKKSGEYISVYINDTVSEDGELVKEKSHSVWLKWSETVQLGDAINTIEEQLLCSEVLTAEQSVLSKDTTPTAGKSRTTGTMMLKLPETAVKLPSAKLLVLDHIENQPEIKLY